MKQFLSMLAGNLYPHFPPITRPFLDNVLRNGAYLSRKTFNFFLNQLEVRLNKATLFSYPYYLVADPTNICNLKCPLCPTWRDPTARPKGKMDIRFYYNLMDEVGPYLFTINLCNWGEPFLNADLPAMISYAGKYNVVTGISTNLNHLSREAARDTIHAGLDIMVISIDGASQTSYSKYRQGGDFEKVMGNVKMLNSLREESPKFPLLVWQFLVNRYNESEIEAARKMAEELGLLFVAAPMRSSMGKELILPLHERIEEMKDWLPENPAYNKYPRNIAPSARTSKTTCSWLWSAAVVNWDGSLSPCCGVFEKSWDFTSCSENRSGRAKTFHQAWNSPQYKLARGLISANINKSSKLPALMKAAKDADLICRNCVRYGFLED